MMKILWYLISFILYHYGTDCVQPYFPSQIVFSPDNGVTTIAVDEINQRAYKSIDWSSTDSEKSFALKHFPFADTDTPQSKYYVQLLIDSPSFACAYGIYWKYGRNNFNSFPSHWTNGTSFEIKTYIQFDYEMIHSTNSSLDEDYWYTNQTCQTDSGAVFHCQEIFFKKGTQIPLRSTEVVRVGGVEEQIITNYQLISMGKPDDKYFDSIPKNWTTVCRDVKLGVSYDPQVLVIHSKPTGKVQVSLTAPPHQTHGNDTVTIQWKANNCTDCFKFTPNQLSFNSENFQIQQTINITRLKASPTISLIPIFHGGAFDVVPGSYFPLYIE